MTNEKILISKQAYVGYNHRNENADEGPVKLAFLTYTPLDDTGSQKSAFEKRKSTVDSWHSRTTYDWKTRTHTENGLETETIDNELLDGYKIADHVRRYSGWGNGNVVWRIADPRGFEFEITSPNMASIMDTCTITNGVIEGKCILGWTKGKVVLLPVSSQPYIDAIITTEAKSHSVSMKDVKPGDHIVLSNENETSGKYLGRFHYLGWSNMGEGYYTDQGKQLFSTDRSQCFILQDNGTLYVSASLKVSRCDSKNSKRTPDQYCEQINTLIEAGNSITVASRDYHRSIVAVRVKKIDVSQTSLEVRPSDRKLADENNLTMTRDSILFRDDAKMLYAASKYGIYRVEEHRLAQHQYGLELRRGHFSYSYRATANDVANTKFGLDHRGYSNDGVNVIKMVNTLPRFELFVLFESEEYPSGISYTH